MNFLKKYREQALIVILGILLFIPYLGSVHLFDWDEINFAEAAREMIVTGDYLTVRIDYEPFHEKPPMFFWLQAVSMKVFGVNEFAARLPNALTGILALLFIFSIGKKFFDEKFGLLWVLAYTGSFLPHFYFKSGIIDPVFNLFIFASIYYLSDFIYQGQFHSAYGKPKIYKLSLAAILCSLAILTKGPVAYLLIFLTIFLYWIINRKQLKFPIRELMYFTVISFAPLILWYCIDFFATGANVITGFIDYQVRLLTTRDAGHGGPIYYHFLILFFGCFPASILMLRGFRKRSSDSLYQAKFKQWNIVLLCVVVGVFSLVTTKIIHYSSLAYYPITFLAAYAMYHIAYKNLKWKSSTNWLTGIIGFVWAAAFIALPLILMNIDIFLPKITDKFTHALLETKVHWGGYESLIGLIFLIFLAISIILFIRKDYLKGFMFLFGSTAFVLFLFLPLIAPKIEPYTQGAPVEFYKSLKGKDCYIEAIGFKSYAHYFYSEKPQELSAFHKKMTQGAFEKWLLTGEIDKPAYFVTKNKGYEKYLEYPGVEVLFEKSGFVFLVRMPVKLNNK